MSNDSGLSPLLSPAQMRQLDALSIHARRAFTGASKGEKRSTKRGASVEFADFRAYNFGDDLRRVDWNAYGRFEKLFLKMFLEEEDLDIALLLDNSPSMGFEDGEKWRMARQLAASLGYIGLTHYDRVSALCLGTSPRDWMAPTRGRNGVPNLMRWLENSRAQTEATNDFSSAMRQVSLRASRPGIAVVISDFLLHEGYETGLKTLAARGFEIIALQVLAREELQPTIAGDWNLTDIENKSVREVSISANLLRTYQKRLDAHTSGLRAFCLRYGFRYALIAADTPLETAVLRLLRGGEIVR